MPESIKVLLVEDNPDDADLVLRALRRGGFEPDWTRVDTEAEYLASLRDGLALILSDFEMPQFNGIRALELLRQSGRDIPFIIVSGTIGEETAVAAMKNGAADYLLKDRLARLGPAVSHALEQARLRRERRGAEDELRKTNAQLQHLLDYSPVVIYGLKLEGRAVIPQLVSENIKALLGFTPAEAFSYDWWFGQLHPDDRDRAVASIAETVAQGTNRTTYRIRHKDGSYRWVEDHCRLIRDITGKPAELVGGWTDVTERMRAEEVLRSAAARQVGRKNATVIAELVIVFGLSALCAATIYITNIMQVPVERVVKKYGTLIDETAGAVAILLIGLGLFSYRRWREAQNQAAHERPIQEALRTLHAELDTQVRQRTAELAKANEVLRTEMEERKRADDALVTAEARYRGIFDNAIEGIYQTTSDGRFVTANPAMARILGYDSPQDLIRTVTNAAEQIYSDPKKRAEAAELLRRQGSVSNEEAQVRRKDGRLIWVSSNARVILDENGTVRYEGTMEDITERKHLEEQFRQSQKMEAIGTLAGGIAHDFNNILTVINGYADLIKMTASDNPELMQHVDAMGQAGARATKLVRQILTFSRREEARRSVIRLEPVVEEALRFLRATIPSTVEFNVVLPGNTAPVLADATQVHQIVMNLGTNSWHAMKDRPGRLGVTLMDMSVDGGLAESHLNLRPGPYVRLSVSDTGKGMDQATMDRIFEPFFTTKSPGEGTGLGLSVVHGIMRSHDGAVAVESKPGIGTTFHLYFPAVLTKVDATAVQAAPVPRGQGEKILYVDDEEPIAEMARKILIHLGYAAEARTRASEAVDLVRANPGHFDLVVADLTMPVITGIDLARQLAQIRPALPVILATGDPGTLKLETTGVPGIREILLKPLSVQSLGMAVQRVLARRKTG